MNPGIRAFLRNFIKNFDKESLVKFTPEQRREAAKKAAAFLRNEIESDRLQRLAGFVRDILEELS